MQAAQTKGVIVHNNWIRIANYESTHPYFREGPLEGNCKPVKATFAHLLRPPRRREGGALIRRAISLTKSKCPFGPRRHYRRDEEAADALTEGTTPSEN